MFWANPPQKRDRLVAPAVTDSAGIARCATTLRIADLRRR